jgi:hypothetical protein
MGFDLSIVRSCRDAGGGEKTCPFAAALDWQDELWRAIKRDVERIKEGYAELGHGLGSRLGNTRCSSHLQL